MNTTIAETVRQAKVYDLGQPYWWGMPVHPADPPFLIFLYRYHEHTQRLFEKIAPGSRIRSACSAHRCTRALTLTSRSTCLGI